jgi:hypothetical protein
MAEMALIRATTLGHEFLEERHPGMSWVLWQAVKRRTLEGKLTPLVFFRTDGSMRDMSIEILAEASKNFSVELPRGFKPSDKLRHESLPLALRSFDNGDIAAVNDEFGGWESAFYHQD